jgi:hypothetical protein
METFSGKARHEVVGMNEQLKNRSSLSKGRLARLMKLKVVGWVRAVGNLFYYAASGFRRRFGLWWQRAGRQMVVKGFVRLAVVAVFCVMAFGLVNYSYRMYSFRQPLGQPSVEQEINLGLGTVRPKPLEEKDPEETVIDGDSEGSEVKLSGRIALGPPPDELFAGEEVASSEGDIEVVAAAVGSRENMLGGIDAAASRPQANPANMIWPVSGQVAVGYGWIRHPVYRDWRFHPGIELATVPGAQVAAVMDGRVRRIQSERTQGLSVTVDHGDGWETTYRGLSQLQVSEGTVVRRGQIIGTAGPGSSSQTGRLVFEIRHGDTPLEPRMYLP